MRFSTLHKSALERCEVLQSDVAFLKKVVMAKGDGVGRVWSKQEEGDAGPVVGWKGPAGERAFWSDS